MIGGEGNLDGRSTSAPPGSSSMGALEDAVLFAWPPLHGAKPGISMGSSAAEGRRQGGGAWGMETSWSPPGTSAPVTC